MKKLLRTWYRILALFSLVAVLSCTPLATITTGGTLHLPSTSHYDLWLDPSLSAQSRAAVVAAATQWSTYTDVTFAVHDGLRLCVDQCFSVREVGRAQLDGLTEGDYVGYTIPGAVFLAGGLPDTETRTTAIHELGHCLGLVHRPPGTNSVMVAEIPGAAQHITCDDVAQFYAERGRAPPASLPACTDAPGVLP